MNSRTPRGESARSSSALATSAPAKRKNWSRVAADIAQPVAALIGFVVIWEAACRVFSIPAYLVPTPSAIFTDTWKLVGQVSVHTLATTQTTLLGFLASLVVSLPL